MFSKVGFSSLILTLSLGAGCSQPDYHDFGLVSAMQASLEDNGKELNGLKANGLKANGLKANGLKANGLKANGLKANGISSHISSITNGFITAVADDLSVTFNSSQLNGTTVEADLEDGDTTSFRIDATVYNPSLGTNVYYLSNFDGVVWSPVCGIDSTGTYAPVGTPIGALAFSDTWNLINGTNVSDPNLFTFGCVNAALGKCAVWGYKRWLIEQECVSAGTCLPRDMSFFHEACTKMVRADYCGDGNFHTANGTGIDIYDALNIQTQTPDTGWTMEAEWRHDGGHCIRHTRWNAANPVGASSDLDYIQQHCPSRLAANNSSCADPSASKFFKSNGYNEPLSTRFVLRNDSYQH